jgi:4-oxalocrotonate tautomerase
MPLVNVKVLEGVFSPEQKKALIKGMTDVIVAAKGENLRQVIWVVIEEVKSGEWGIGGKPLTTADVEALVAGRPKKG